MVKYSYIQIYLTISLESTWWHFYFQSKGRSQQITGVSPISEMMFMCLHFPLVMSKYENQIIIFTDYLEEFPDTDELVWILGKQHLLKTGKPGGCLELRLSHFSFLLGLIECCFDKGWCYYEIDYYVANENLLASQFLLSPWETLAGHLHDLSFCLYILQKQHIFILFCREALAPF